MDLGLKGKHAIVTGGSLGIGKAIARELAKEGVDVAIVARNKERLEATAKELAAETGRKIIALPTDVTSKEQVEAMVAQAASQLGGLHILVNSGSSPGGSTTATGRPSDSRGRLRHTETARTRVRNRACARHAIPRRATRRAPVVRGRSFPGRSACRPRGDRSCRFSTAIEDSFPVRR